jgi:NADPH:quinone reductase-like Zn-dependent oxidoreductase
MIDYTAEDFTQGRHRYDVVIDAVGKSTFGRCRRILEPGGAYVSSELGPGWQNLPLAVVTPLLRRYPLDEIAEAHRYVETGQKVGNVVITVTGEAGPPPRS